MSVINQMLKDLDERQNEQQHSHSNQVPMKRAGSPWKMITLIIVIVIALNITGIFIWQLYSENESLKNINDNSYDQNQQAQQLIEGLEKKLQTARSEGSASANDEIVPSELEHQEDKTQQVIDLQGNPDKSILSKGDGISPQVKDLSEPLATEKSKDVIDKTIQKVIQTTSSNNVVVNKLAEDITTIKESVKPTLSISRKQLTASELSKQKVDQAEQALAENKLSKAEQLFEDVLLMTPEHKAARKQLAALWFGRQSYQSALNVLSQGIQLFPEDSEFRLMKARIYLNQGQTTSAVNTLKGLPHVENVEYQALLASHAQQISQFDVATTAYNLLTTLEPNAGRWWLGLAVAYDSNSEFDHAVKAYDQAIDKSDLSENARQFARQRVQELGE
jgi:MSHA biogenesis protein MshN